MSNETTPTPTDGQVEPVAYPVIVDEKTLFALIQSAEAIIRNPRPDRVEAFAEAKVTIFAQMRNTDAENAALREELAEARNQRDAFHLSARTAEAHIGELRAELARLREENSTLRDDNDREREEFRDQLFESTQERNTLRASNAGLVEALGVADKMILHHCNPEDARMFQGDWACAECRPYSEILKPGFQCAFHSAKDRGDYDAALSTLRAGSVTDKERLDGIKPNWTFGYEQGAYPHPDRWFIYDEDWSLPFGEGPTLRAAIDQALDAANRQPGRSEPKCERCNDTGLYTAFSANGGAIPDTDCNCGATDAAKGGES